MNIEVKEKTDGSGYFYSFSLAKIKEDKPTALRAVEADSLGRDETSPIDTLSQNKKYNKTVTKRKPEKP